MSDKSDKKFANLHYPGMKVDPNERAEKKDAFKEALSESSVLILTPTPFAVELAKKLLKAGMGRVGIFGQHSSTNVRDLSAWAKIETPDVQFESFSTESIDRSLEDIVRGFDVVVPASDDDAKRAAQVASTCGKTLIMPSDDVSDVIIEHVTRARNQTSST